MTTEYEYAAKYRPFPLNGPFREVPASRDMRTDQQLLRGKYLQAPLSAF